MLIIIYLIPSKNNLDFDRAPHTRQDIIRDLFATYKDTVSYTENPAWTEIPAIRLPIREKLIAAAKDWLEIAPYIGQGTGAEQDQEAFYAALLQLAEVAPAEKGKSYQPFYDAYQKATATHRFLKGFDAAQDTPALAALREAEKDGLGARMEIYYWAALQTAADRILSAGKTNLLERGAA